MSRQTVQRRPQESNPIVLTGRDSFPNNKSIGVGGNQLIPTTIQTRDRKYIWPLDYDIHRNVTDYGRKVMLTLGRRLYASSDVVRGAIREMASTAAKSYIPEYRGLDQEFETQVHSWITQQDRVCDIAGAPYTMRTYRQLLIKAVFYDGDMGTLFVRDADGQPRLQIIPSHRIGSAEGELFVKGGPYDGARIISGVILGDHFNAIAYRILTGDNNDYKTYVDMPRDRMTLSFIPHFPGQVRGFSEIGYSAFNWQDLAESDRWELLAQKAGAGRVFQEWNDEGEPTPGADYITAPAAGTTPQGTPTGLWYETIEGGINSYFKSSDRNAQIKAVTFDRPSSNQQAFHKAKIREALYALGWSDMYSLSDEASGAFLRVLVDKLNDSIDDLGDDVIEPAVRRFDAFRIPVAMTPRKQGGIEAIKFTADWHNIEYTRARRKTPDRRYDIEVTEKELRLGITTRSRAMGERGETEDYVRPENQKSVDDLLTRVEQLADKHPRFTPETILSFMELLTVNANLPAPAASAKPSEREAS